MYKSIYIKELAKVNEFFQPFLKIVDTKTWFAQLNVDKCRIPFHLFGPIVMIAFCIMILYEAIKMFLFKEASKPSLGKCSK